MKNKTIAGHSTNGSSTEYLKLEIADEDIREQVNRQYFGDRSFFLDKATAEHQESMMMVDDSMLM